MSKEFKQFNIGSQDRQALNHITLELSPGTLIMNTVNEHIDVVFIIAVDHVEDRVVFMSFYEALETNQNRLPQMHVATLSCVLVNRDIVLIQQ